MYTVFEEAPFSAPSSEFSGGKMGPLEFVASILAGYIALYVMFRVADAWHMGRVRDRRVREWNEMVARERKKREK